ncbi:MAG: Oxygen-sensitive ribonucleoside-triphosphate reductase [candidate division TM6 bacterium GW2011_GWE2_41_16]|nr:MAG: Oxygen-sensitive ribonucleoside-triphosphate reductase [candidate division TM6 bacterium GW2011_GWE2_41_16]
MFTKIFKRDGSVTEFAADKITQAIMRAGYATGEFDHAEAMRLTKMVLDILAQRMGDRVPRVEEIQDAVEEVLINSAWSKTAKAYILYRQKHAEIRKTKSQDNNTLIDKYLERIDWQVNENANTDYSLQGLNNYIYGEVSKEYWLYKIYPEEIRLAAEDGDFHIHDLQFLAPYCVGWDLQDILMVGFKGVSGKIESRPAKHFRTALGQVVNFFYTLQGESAGACALSNFDTLLAPFIRYDKLSYPEVKQAMQEFIYNMNVPTRVGFQTPFTNVTLDLQAPKMLASQPVIIGGEHQKETYGEFQKEMDLFNQAFTEVITEGDAKGRVFTFPIPTYNITADFDWNNKNLEGLWHMTAKYGIPYFANFVNSDLDPEDARSMCCRLRLDNRELRKRGGGLFGSNPLTGSIGVVTINLPRIGYQARDNKDFMQRLVHAMDLAKSSLEIKRKFLERFTQKGLYPYARFYLRSVKEHSGKYWANHFSTIGLVGLNEACLNFFGEEIVSPKGRAFAEEVLDVMREQCQKYQQETGHMYNLEATPAEGTSYRLAKKDKDKFPHCVVANEKQHQEFDQEPYYTNSSQAPLGYTDDVFELLDMQDPLQIKYTGGTVVHLFIGEEITDIEAMKKLIKTVCHTYKLPYFTITPTFSICDEHGYTAGKVPVCVKCGGENNVYSRIVGYLRPVRQWNPGKKAEFSNRKTFHIPTDDKAKK